MIFEESFFGSTLKRTLCAIAAALTLANSCRYFNSRIRGCQDEFSQHMGFGCEYVMKEDDVQRILQEKAEDKEDEDCWIYDEKRNRFIDSCVQHTKDSTGINISFIERYVKSNNDINELILYHFHPTRRREPCVPPSAEDISTLLNANKRLEGYGIRVKGKVVDASGVWSFSIRDEYYDTLLGRTTAPKLSTSTWEGRMRGLEYSTRIGRIPVAEYINLMKNAGVNVEYMPLKDAAD